MANKLLKKDLHPVVSKMAKEAHRAVNNICLSMPFTPTPGFVKTHERGEPPAGAVEWEGFTLEVSACRRSRVVCNVPTPFSLFTFNYCLKRDGKQLAHGTTIPEFLDSAMRAVKRMGL